jgi:mycothiol synthase
VFGEGQGPALRAYRDEDAPRVVELLRDIRNADGVSTSPGHSAWLAFVANRANRGGHDFRCIEEGGALVAILASGWFDDGVVAGGVQVGRVLVHPHARRRGLGRLLLIELERQASQRGAGAIQGIVHRGSTAGSSFAARNGFQVLVRDLRMARALDEPIPACAPPAAVNIRPYRGADDDAPWAELANACFARDKVVARLSAARVAELARAPDCAMRAAEIAGRMVGFCWVDGPGPEVGVVQGLGVDERHRRNGVARALLVDALRLLAGRGHTRAELTTEEDNEPAIALYRAYGFTVADLVVTWRRSVR